MNRKKSRILWLGMMVLALTLVVGIGFSACDSPGDSGGGGSGSGGGGSDTPDTTPRANVSDLARSPVDGQIRLNWTNPEDADLDHIEITWEPGGTDAQTVAKEEQTYLTTGLMNKIVYTFTVKAVYTGNIKSSGQTISSAFTSIDDIETYLDNVSGGTDVAPAFLPVSLDLSSDQSIPPSDESVNWKALLSKIAAVDKFVDMDLSACTMTGVIFNPGSGLTSTGKDKVVSLVLPDAAEEIMGNYVKTSTYPQPYSQHFTNLTSVSGNNILRVRGRAFITCAQLVTVNFPKAEHIEAWAFEKCTQLVTVSFPKVEKTGSGAFEGCTQLAEVSLPAAKIIGGTTFAECYQLTMVELPAVEDIGFATFSLEEDTLLPEYTPLTVIMGSTVPILEQSMFADSGKVRTVTVRVPSDADAWSGITAIGTFSSTNNDVNWGNGFRGNGWMNNGFVTTAYINSSITLTVTTIE